MGVLIRLRMLSGLWRFCVVEECWGQALLLLLKGQALLLRKKASPWQIGRGLAHVYPRSG